VQNRASSQNWTYPEHRKCKYIQEKLHSLIRYEVLVEWIWRLLSSGMFHHLFW